MLIGKLGVVTVEETKCDLCGEDAKGHALCEECLAYTNLFRDRTIVTCDRTMDESHYDETDWY